MADYAHSKGMIIGFKNAIDIIPDVVASVDFAVNENCFTYSECSSYSPFTKAGKAVFSHNYKSVAQTGSSICSNASKN